MLCLLGWSEWAPLSPSLLALGHTCTLLRCLNSNSPMYTLWLDKKMGFFVGFVYSITSDIKYT